MPRFKHYNYDQDAMIVINYQEQLQPGTFEHAVHYLIEHKLDLSVFHPKYRNQDTGRLPNYTDWMKHRVDSPKGKEIYSHRMSVVEPVFGNIGTTKRLNRFSLRGKKKVQGQWQLYCLVHNIEKLANYGQLAA